jgi:hypothetical protein
MRPFTLGALTVVLLFIALADAAWAHITPPVVLVSDREAVLGLLQGARRFFVREVQLSPAERQAIETQTGWRPDEAFYRFYLGRDDQGGLVAATTFLTEFTIHGPIRVAVALGPQGDVRGATVVELTEETYPWVKPLLDRNFTRQFVGQGSRGTLQVDAPGGSMTEFYGQIVASLIRRAAVLFEQTVLRGAP